MSTLPGSNHSYNVGTWYTLQTQLGHYLCSTEHFIQGDLIHGLTIYQDAMWLCSSIAELREIYDAIMPRNKALRSHQKCNVPTLVRISREPYQMGLLKNGEQPMTALKIIECRALTDEELAAMKAEKTEAADQEETKKTDPESHAKDITNRCDAETSPVPTQPHDTGKTTKPCLTTASPLCPVDRVVELFPRPLYCT